jgi:glycosyltransferase involved in cell wall biosynthesis/LmbE family N-acetylglucosaminyl deacetylase
MAVTTSSLFDQRLIPFAPSALPSAREVLVFAPHGGDEVFGCGATLCRLSRSGASISVIVVADETSGDSSNGRTILVTRESECNAAAGILGYDPPIFWRLPHSGVMDRETLIERVLDALRTSEADLIFVPAITEQPHERAVALAVGEAVRRVGGDRCIAFYETNVPLVPNMLIDITSAEQKKQDAMRLVQSRPVPARSNGHIEALNRYRGYALGNGVHAAEAYFVISDSELKVGAATLLDSPIEHRGMALPFDTSDVPLVSVIVRSMDRPTLREALVSLAAQTYPNLEAVVVNARGSTHSPLPDYGSRLVMRMIETGRPLTRSAAANLGLNAARGTYVALLDDDDTLDPDHLATLVTALHKAGDSAVAYARVRCMARNDPERTIARLIGEPFEAFSKLLADNFIPGPAALFPRRLVESHARFDESLDCYGLWDFWLQLARVARFTYVDRVSATQFAEAVPSLSPLAKHGTGLRTEEEAFSAKWKASVTVDEFRSLAGLYRAAGARAADIEKKLGQSTLQIEALQEQLSALQAELRHNQHETKLYMRHLEAVLASRSWRITSPIRAVSRISRIAAEIGAQVASDTYKHLPQTTRARLQRMMGPVTAWVMERRGANVPRTTGAAPVNYRSAIAAISRSAPTSHEFRENTAPALSIVIAGDVGHEEVLRILGALHRQEGIDSAELIVVVPEAERLAERLKGVRLERGSGTAAQDYARAVVIARSSWVLFLSAECYPLPGMVTHLTRFLAEQKNVGIVVPKFVSAEGELVFPVVSTHALDPNAPEVNFTRPVDHCPAAAFAVRRSLAASRDTAMTALDGWMRVLVAAAREENTRALYLPLMHALVSPKRLRNAPPAPFSAGRGPMRHVLILDQHTPTPDRDSGSVDAYFQMKILVELGYRVTFFATVDLAHVPPYTADLQRIGVECLYPPYAASVAAHLRKYGHRYDYVVLTRLPVAHDFIDLTRRSCRRAVVLFNTVDLHFVREQRQADLTRDLGAARRARDTRRLELMLMRKADATLVISEAEAGLLQQQVPEVRTFHLPLIMDIPDRRETPFAQRKDVFFIGGFRHQPNYDAVLHLIRDIWPLVRARLPEARLHIVGGGAPPEILDLAAPDVVINGYVPHAGRFFNGCRLSVAPLRFGAGVKGKVGRSMGYGCPVVLSPVAAEGTGITDGKDALIASSAADFADAMARLYQDELLWTRLSREGQQFFNAHFSYEVGKKRLAAIMDALHPGAVETHSA